MDPSKFTAAATGRIVPIEGNEFAFIPATLPPAWKFPEELWPLLNEACTKLGLLEGIGRHLPAAELLLRPLERREAVQSSAIEGTYATPRELLLFEIDPIEPTKESDPANSWKEVFNSKQALQFGLTSELPLSLRLIREMHRILLTGIRGPHVDPGEFRRIQVAIGSSRRFVPPPATDLSDCLNAFEKHLHQEGEYHPLVDCMLAHYQFEAIHPFIDGNGRVGRMLLTIMIQRRCALTKPWLYLSDYFARHRTEYVDSLFNVSASGAWTPWIEFCLQGVVDIAESTINRCEELRRLREEYMNRVTANGGSIRLHDIIERLFTAPFIRVADLTRQMGISYPTAKSDVDRLIEAGILSDLPSMPARTVYSPEIYRVAYADLG